MNPSDFMCQKFETLDSRVWIKNGTFLIYYEVLKKLIHFCSIVSKLKALFGRFLGS